MCYGILRCIKGDQGGSAWISPNEGRQHSPDDLQCQILLFLQNRFILGAQSHIWHQCFVSTHKKLKGVTDGAIRCKVGEERTMPSIPGRIQSECEVFTRHNYFIRIKFLIALYSSSVLGTSKPLICCKFLGNLAAAKVIPKSKIGDSFEG